jgi:hypothetical protein
METDGMRWNTLETTCIVQVRARLTPTLTHVVTYELVTSGAEDDAMSMRMQRVTHVAGCRDAAVMWRHNGRDTRAQSTGHSHMEGRTQ